LSRERGARKRTEQAGDVLGLLRAFDGPPCSLPGPPHAARRGDLGERPEVSLRDSYRGVYELVDNGVDQLDRLDETRV